MMDKKMMMEKMMMEKKAMGMSMMKQLKDFALKVMPRGTRKMEKPKRQLKEVGGYMA